MLAVSVSENGMAQTVQLCSAGQAEHSGTNPHTPTTFDEQSCRTDGAIITFPAGKSGFVCRQCAGHLATGTSGFCDSIYQIEGDTLSYCGPRSQCNAVGGILENAGGTPTGEVCKCDAGNARIGGVCVTGETAGDCETFEEYASTEDADRTEGACRPRVAGDCTDPNDEFVADTTNGGGTCECNEGYSRNSAGVCVLGQVCPNNAFHTPAQGNSPHDPDGSQRSVCASEGTIITDPNDRSCGACRPDTCPTNGGVIYSVGGETLEFCGTTTQCEAVSGVVENGNCSRECAPGFELGTLGLNNNRCIPVCLSHQERNVNGNCVECSENEEQGDDGSCISCPIANEVRARGETSCSCKDPHVSVSGECRLPTDNEECAQVGDGSTPIFDASEPNRCRAPEAGSECPAGEVLLTGAAACTACTGLLTPNNDRDACECADPNVSVSGECRLPAENGECAQVGDGSAPIFDAGEPTNCRAPEAGSECPTDQVLLTGSTACTACTGLLTPNTERTACECADPNVEVGGECRLPAENGECAQVGDGSAPIFDAGEPTNCRAPEAGSECPTNQVLLTGSTACTACTGLLTPNTERTACECADPNVEVNGECQAEVSSCPDAHHRPVNNVCVECETDQHLVNGTCVACPDNEVRATGDAACECNSPNVEVGNECRAMPTCADRLTPNAQNECHCNPDINFEETDGSCVPHTDCTGEGANVIRNTETNACVCADNSEGTPETACTACTGGKTSQGGAACACPADTLPFENSEGVCEASREGTCMDPQNTYNSATNECDCPAGERLNADESDCEAIPASGGGGSSGGGAAAALIAVPIVLIGGYWLLGGFDYIDPTYNLSYSGENDDLAYTGQGGFQLNHGNLHSFAQAIQSNGNAVAYESGISYGGDLYSLNYAAYERKSEYDYDLSASLNYGEGTWSISPTADAEFHYSADSEDWTADAGAGLTAAWTSHRWNVRAHSAFAGDLNHGLDVEFRF